MRIAIQPFGQVPQTIIEELAEDLRGFPAEIGVDVLLSLPENAYESGRGQYRADAFLEMCERQAGDRVLGVTSVDLYAEPLNFVFGQAEVAGRAAVISIARLVHANRVLFRGRIAKEAVHELGHTFGLTHCSDDTCVMRFSNSLADTDLKGKEFCRSCASAIPRDWRPRRR